MASTNKTTNLKLNNWEESDCPKRSDFVQDNLIIDNLLGNHIKDMNLHLTPEEKDRVANSFDITTIYGTGEEETMISFPYTPALAMIFAKNTPFTITENGYTKVNSGVAFSAGTTGGIIIQGNKVAITQSETQENGVFYNLNNSDKEYMLITFK